MLELKNHKSYKIKYYLLRVLDVLVALTPIIIFACLNLDKYFGHKESKFSNIIGFALVLVVAAIVLLKKTKMLQGLLGLIILECILIFMDVYVKDLKFIVGYAIIGIVISKITIHPLVNRYDRLWKAHENAEITSEAMNNNINKIVDAIKGSGRA